MFNFTVPDGYDPPNLKCLPEGLTILKNFVSVEEEEVLLNCIIWNDVSCDTGKVLFV